MTHAELPDWSREWQKRLESEADPVAVMNAANPIYIPRNHRIEEMIQAALKGDLAPFDRLNRVLANPYEQQSGEDDLTLPPTADEEIEATFCGT